MFRNVWSVFTSQTSEVGLVYCMWLSISKGLWMYYKSKSCIFVTQNNPFEWVTSSPTLHKAGKRLHLLFQEGLFQWAWLLFWGLPYLSPITPNLTPTYVWTMGQLCMYVSTWESVGETVLKVLYKSLGVSGCRWMQTYVWNMLCPIILPWSLVQLNYSLKSRFVSLAHWKYCQSCSSWQEQT